jgi:hypothetical protein
MSYSTSGPVETILRKEDTVDPVAGNDNTQGYSIKSRWINTSSNEEWVCTDASTGAALWELTTGGGGDVVGPGVAVWHDVAKFNGTTGKLIQTSTLNVNTAGQVIFSGTTPSLDINERGTAPVNTGGRGKIWVKDDAPTTPMFTDDDTGDYDLMKASTAPGNNYIIMGTSVGSGADIKSASTFNYSAGSLNMTYATGSRIRMKEAATAVTTPSAGEGLWWVRDDAPTTPHFTDDDDVDHNLNRPTPTTLASNALIDVDATEVVIGGAYLDGSTGGTYSWEILGTLIDGGTGTPTDVDVRLYDMGPDGTPAAGILRSTLTISTADSLDRVSLALTPASSPGVDTDTFHDSAHMYEVRAYLNATGGIHSASILNVKFVEA